MNIYLVPFTWARHIVVAIAVGAAALLAWWAALAWVVWAGPLLSGLGFLWLQSGDGAVFLCGVSSAVAIASLMAEGSLRRRALRWRLLYAGIAGSVSFLLTLLGWLALDALTPYLGGKQMGEILSDPSLVTLRYKLLVWVWAGGASGFGPFVARRLQQVVAGFGYGRDSDIPHSATMAQVTANYVQHVVSGMVAGALGAAVWHMLGFYPWLPGDLYLASAYGALVWGLTHGALCWGIPDELYAGWVRVLSADRFGLRIPIDHADLSPAERFVGHYPRGLDMYQPVEHGVAELHTSFVVDENFHYAVRGLSQRPTLVKRSLESIDLHYAEHRPAPLETSLRMEDKVMLGEGAEQCTLEFLLLPKEER